MEGVDFNLDHFWMPFTDNKYFKSNPKLLMRADGKYYYDRFNKQILDASSGLLCCPLGHNRAEIIEAIKKPRFCATLSSWTPILISICAEACIPVTSLD